MVWFLTDLAIAIPLLIELINIKYAATRSQGACGLLPQVGELLRSHSLRGQGIPQVRWLAYAAPYIMLDHACRNDIADPDHHFHM